jgi:hypothetical protein
MPVLTRESVKQDALRKTIYDLLKEHYPEKVLGWVKKATWSLKDVDLSEINMSRRPGGRNMGKVNNIAKAILDGKKMGPVVLVTQSTGRHQIADGYHRTLGFQKAEKTKIKAYVATGLEDDGPWDEEMHANKLNVEPGKKANVMELELIKLAATFMRGRDFFREGPEMTAEKKHIQSVVAQSRVKAFQELRNRADLKPKKETKGLTRRAHFDVLGLPKLADDQEDELGILARLGIMAGTTGVGAGAGHLLDRKMGSTPIGLALGGLAGLTMGAAALGNVPSPEQLANSAVATMMMAQQLQELRKSYSPEIAQKVEEKKTVSPTTTARKGGFSSKESFNLTKTAAEYIDLRFCKIAGLDTDLIETESAPKPASTKSREYYLKGVGKKEDKKGWYVCTHRARSKSYPSIADIPLSVLKFIESTG